MLNIKKIKLGNYVSTKGQLSIIEESKNVLFRFKRVFFVKGKKNITRGMHAHKKCSQIFICLNERVKIKCDDGVKKKTFILKDSKFALLIPPMIWSDQTYLSNKSILAVICDQKYDKNDYIHDYSNFIDIINR